MTSNMELRELHAALSEHGNSLDGTQLHEFLQRCAITHERKGKNCYEVGLNISNPLGAQLHERLAIYAKTQKQQPASLTGNVVAKRLEHLREVMRANDISWYLQPRTDEFQGEYLAEYAERVGWLSGFTGSAGTLIVGLEQAAIFVDGRYSIQVLDEVDDTLFTICNSGQIRPRDWLLANATSGEIVGYDGWLMTRQQIDGLREPFDEAGITLSAIANLIDQIWADQPARPIGPVELHDGEYSGKTRADKIAALCAQMCEDNIDYCVLGASDAIAWLLNIRGSDVPFNPVIHSWVIMAANGKSMWFVDALKIDEQVRSALRSLVEIRSEQEFPQTLSQLAKGKIVGAQLAQTPDAVATIIEDNAKSYCDWDNRVMWNKACKTPAEIDGAHVAQFHDGVAMIEFLAELTHKLASDDGDISEMQACAMINAKRLANPDCVDLSFDTISATGPHGAICHYRVSERTDRILRDDDLYLVDSGGQYRSGTTDITRTIAVSDAAITPWRMECYTRVLQGHIALASAKFPKGTTGSHLDVLARKYLWQAGLDFDHGTGHGVGSFLNVHEGPQSISRASHKVALEVGMIISNEPGYYAADDFGIRIENLVCVKQADDGFLMLETLSHVPIDLRLVDVSMLGHDHIAWLNEYHANIWHKYHDQLSERAKDWLQDACRAV